jgi:hypothetical protein
MASNDVLNRRRRDEQAPFRDVLIEDQLSKVERNTCTSKKVGLFITLVSSLTLWLLIGLAIAEAIGRGPI